MKKALITGVTGQDGSYLAELLADKKYEVYGLIRRSSTDPLMRIQHLVSDGKLALLYGNLRDVRSIREAMEVAQPDEVYNLAALSDVGISFKCPEETFDVNYVGVGKVVDEALRVNSDVRIYQASTSEMFGRAHPPQNEDSEFLPVSPYGEAKLKAHIDIICRYREQRGAFTCAGILFNHESPRRGKHFVTRKVTHSLSKIKEGLQDVLQLGNMDAKRDWGFAGDYVEAMWLMLQQDTPDDYVVATGESHSVRDMVDVAAAALDMPIKWEGEDLDEIGKNKDGEVIVQINKKFYRPKEVDHLEGDSSKARKILGWKPKTSFEELVRLMVTADLKRVQQMYGESTVL